MHTRGTIIQNRILKVDLSEHKVEIENPGDPFYRKYLGGRTIALYYLTTEGDPKCDPLDASNVLVFAAGLLNGIPCSGVPKFSIAAKSPLTGGVGESEAGGYWGSSLRFCGFDAIVAKGRSPEPVYLCINDEGIRLKSAKDIWMTDTLTSQLILHEKHPKARILQIGPAGCHQVLFANITNELSFFNGRNGLGAVMGSKRLKAIVLQPSRQKVEAADPEGLQELARAISSSVKNNPLSKALNNLGTAGGVVPVNSAGILPTRNWTQSEFSAAEQIGGETLRDNYLQKRHGCFGCSIRCKRVVEVRERDIVVDPQLGGPEYESLVALGSLCGISDMAVVCKANELCNSYGMDTISMGATAAFAMQCFEEKLLTTEDIGYDLSFGNGNSLIKLIEDVAYRKGYGEFLALGSYRAAERLGGKAKEFCHHAKKQELPMHDPRVKTGLGLQYALSPRGADHWVAQHDPFFSSDDSPGVKELAGIGINNSIPNVSTAAAKVRFFYYTNILCSAYDSLGVCTLAAVSRSAVTLDQILSMVRASTDWNTTWFEIMKCGERANNLARLFNVSAGFGSKDDCLPAVFTENINKGPQNGTGAIDKRAFESAVKLFYEMAGWDEEGVPKVYKLEELGI